MSVAYTLQPDPPPWTLPEQGISRGWEPTHKGWGGHIGIKQFPEIFKVLGHKNMVMYATATFWQVLCHIMGLDWESKFY